MYKRQSLNKREQFLEMIADAKRGKIDMIITKSVSRFARNVVDFISMRYVDSSAMLKRFKALTMARVRACSSTVMESVQYFLP